MFLTGNAPVHRRTALPTRSAQSTAPRPGPGHAFARRPYTPPMTPERRHGLLMAATTALLWGFLPIALKVASGDIDQVSIVWFRFAFAFLALLAFVGVRDRRRLRVLVKPPVLAVVAGICLTVNYLTYLAGVHLTGPSNAQVLIQLAPLMFAGLGIACFGERLARRQIIGVVGALAGFAAFYSDQLTGRVGDASGYREGTLMILIAAFAWTGYAALQKLLTRRGSAPQDMNLVLYALPAIVMLPWVDFGAMTELSLGFWVLLVFLGANTLLAYGALGEALKRLPAHEVSLIITLNPLITLVVMAVLDALAVEWIASDRVTGLGYLGAFCVVAGVFQVLARSIHHHAAPDTSQGARALR